MKNKISVIIPTLNRNKPLVDILSYLFKEKKQDDFEIFVVDQSDAHDLETTLFLKKNETNFHHYKVSFKNLCTARNFGVKVSDGDIVLFLDDDVVPCEGFLGAHKKSHESDDVAAVTGPLIGNSSSFKLLPRESFSESDLKRLLLGQDTNFKADFAYFSTQANGCNMSFRRAWIKKAGGFDENFYGSSDGEDFEFSYRLRRAGGKIFYNPSASVLYVPYETGGCRDLTRGSFIESKSFNSNYFLLRTNLSFGSRARRMWQVFRGNVLHKKVLMNGRFFEYFYFFIKGLLISEFKNFGKSNRAT